MVAMPATVATRSTQQEQNIEKQLLEDSSVHEDSNESNGMTGLLSSNIHGLCELPEGYHLMQVPRKATFAGEDDLPVDHRPCYNLVRVLASIIQLIFAISTLYRTRGDQIERYGYAAFGLTVIPYAWMSLINLVGNAICPQYDKIYVVSSRALRDLQLARKEGSQDSQTQDQTQWRVDGTVGRLEDHWDEQLCKNFEYCREQECAEQTGRTRPLLYTVFATWNRKSPSRMILGPFIDLLNPFRHWKDWVEDTRKARRWWKDEVMHTSVEMALALRRAASLKPEVRLAQAVSEFEASLDAEHKASFRNARIATKATPPTPSDVMRLTAEIDYRVRQEHGPSRCFGPRLTNILQAVQQFAALGDTVVGGSQNLVACMVQMAIGYASYLEKLSLLFMTAGRQAPRYQALAIIYPQSKTLQLYLSEYFIVIVRICQRIQQYAKKSAFGQFKSSLTDADLKEDQADLELWGNSIKDEASLLLNRRVHDESQENQKARAWVSRWSASSSQQYALEHSKARLDVALGNLGRVSTMETGGYNVGHFV
ncbi:hypothetical protein K4K57_000814 [Colletotrichum sp. SAR 10_99]|nr:hypothetical protein K4K55_006191 [Colletotrichum sp. SAR 10_96]KAJ5014937.1 hypothetical protein K4K57_000814 [Colletotrichum sp. SAR 10_99]